MELANSPYIDLPTNSSIEFKTFEDLKVFIANEFELYNSILEPRIDFIYNYKLPHNSDSLFEVWKVYEWTPEVYKYFVLLRDSLFVLHKSIIYKNDNFISEESFIEKRKEISNIIGDARDQLNNSFESKKNYFDENIDFSIIDKWKHQQNSVQVYRDQLTQLASQISKLNNQHSKMSLQQDLYHKVKTLIKTENGNISKELETFKSVITDIIQKVESSEEKLDLVSFEKHLIKSQNLLNEFDKSIELTSKIELIFVKDSNISQIVVGREEFDLILSNYGFSEKTLAWIESEITPQYNTLNSYIHELRSITKISLMNMSNYVSLKKNDEHETTNFTPLLKSFNHLNTTLQNLEQQFEQIQLKVDKLTTDELIVSNVFNIEKPFLNQNEYLASKYLINTNSDLLSKMDNWGSKIEDTVLGFISRVEKEEKLSESEKLVRFLKSRKYDLENQNYTNIFLTKGYTGSSFAVGRDKELDHLVTLYKSWKEGYRGSVCLTGNRFSGKTFLGELFLNRLEKQATVKLEVGQNIIIDGRSFRVTTNLDESLSFIKKYARNQQYVIWIDDLETFWNSDSHLLNNARALKKFIDQYNSRFFVLCSMNDICFDFLNLHTELNLNFQTKFNCSKIENSDLVKALMLRHQATHKKLLNKRDTELSNAEILKLIQSVVSTCIGNIGDALRLWSSHIALVDDLNVKWVEKINYEFPNIDGKENRMLLYDLYLQKNTSEYRLRKQYGQVFSSHYVYLLKRMINIGIVEREADTYLRINDNCVNNIGRGISR